MDLEKNKVIDTIEKLDIISSKDKHKIDYSIDLIFNNPRISDGVKYKIIKRKEALDEFCIQHNLSSYLLGNDSFEDIKGRIPKEEIAIHDLKFSASGFEEYLRSFEVFQEKSKLMTYIEKEVDKLISNYDEELSFFESFRSTKVNYLSIVWINALCILFLIKWLINTKQKNEKEIEITNIIKLGLEWLRDHCNWKDKNLFLYSNTCDSNDRFAYPVKIYETSLVLQIVFRKFVFKSCPLELDFKPTIDKLRSFKKTVKKEEGELAWWPADISIDKNNIDYVEDKTSLGYVGSTSHVLQFLSEIINNYSMTDLPDDKYQENIKDDIASGIRWLLDHQSGSGFWGVEKDSASIQQTCEAIQAILKVRYLFHKQFITDSQIDVKKINDAINDGLNWLSNQFCVETRDAFCYAWPADNDNLEIDMSKPCLKNTALAVSTFLRADISPNSFLIVKPIMWLLNDKPVYEFDNIYKYCSLIDYMKYSYENIKKSPNNLQLVEESR